MVRLGRPERAEGLEAGRDLQSLGLELPDEFFGGLLLVGVLVEDCGAVLFADVGALAVDLCGVVDFEEELGERLEGRSLGIEDHLDGFDVAGPAAADLLVGG